MKLAKGTTKLAILSLPAVNENAMRMRAGPSARLIPPWVIVEINSEKNTSRVINAYRFSGAKLESKTQYQSDRPFPDFVPATRPDYPSESLSPTYAWLETTEELTIQTEETTK